MDNASGPPPFNFFSDRLAEIIKKTIKSQMAQANTADRMQPTLERMVEQQQQTNAQLGHLVTAVSQLGEWVQENTQRIEHNAARRNATPLWKKMALEVPPVVLAVLLAFGINSWWQGVKEEQEATLAVESIIAEIKENDVTLKRNIAKNEAEEKIIAAKIQKIESGEGDSVNAQGPIHMFTLTEAAWQTASLSNVFKNINRDLLMDAAEIYNKQLSREDRIDNYFSTILFSSETFQEDRQAKLIHLRARQSFLAFLTGSDQYKRRLYRQFLEKYDHPQPTANE